LQIEAFVNEKKTIEQCHSCDC